MPAETERQSAPGRAGIPGEGAAPEFLRRTAPVAETVVTRPGPVGAAPPDEQAA